MKKQLREYQLKLVSEIYEKWERGAKAVLAQMPTGAGKSIVIASIVEHEVSKGKKVLVMAHRTELVTQLATHLYEATDIEVGIIKAGFTPNYISPIQVASVQSLSAKRRELTHKFDLIVIDEAHHYTTGTQYDKIVKYYDRAKVLGVTATPQRLDGRGLWRSFDELVIGIAVQELIDQGHLSKFKYYSPDRVMTTDGAEISMGDYTIEAIERLNSHIEVAGMALKAYYDYLVGKSAIIFTTGVEASIEITKAFNGSGIKAEHLDGTTKSEVRQSTLDRFRNKEIEVISNCALFDEGLDIPGLDAAILLRPTLSVSRYLQQVGRPLRVSEDKPFAIIVDLADNWRMHGLPNKVRSWTLSDRPKKEQIIGKEKLERNDDGEIVEAQLIDEIKANVSDVNFIDIDSTASLDKDAVESIKRRTEDDWQVRHEEMMKNREKIVTIINRNLKPSQLEEWVAGGYRWKDYLTNIIETQQFSGYKSGWLVHQIANLNAPIEIYYALADYLGYKKGWAFYKHRYITASRSS